MRALWVLIALSSVAGLTVASTPSEHVDVMESRCWDCHADGVWEPAMRGAELHDVRFTLVDDQWFVEADLKNHWLDEMRNIAGVIHAGSSMTPLARAAETQQFELTMQADARENVAIVEYRVPEGATSLNFNLQQDSALPATLKLEIIPAGGSATVQTRFSADDLATADDGRWLLRVTRSQPSTETSATVTATASKDALLARTGDVGAGETATLRWPVATTSGATTSHVAVYYDTFYDHAPPTGPQEDVDHLVVKHSFAMVVENGVPRFADEPLAGDIRHAEAPGIGLVAILGALGALAWRKR